MLSMVKPVKACRNLACHIHVNYVICGVVTGVCVCVRERETKEETIVAFAGL